MGRIVFAWEFGGGFGHIERILPLATTLQERGHNIFCIMKYVANADKILGQYGITALVVLINSIIVFCILNRKNKRLVLQMIVFLVIIFSLVILYGYQKLQTDYEPEVKVALIQNESSSLSVHKSIIDKVPLDIDIILLPEYALPEYLEDDDGLLSEIKNITTTKDTFLITGSKDRLQDNKDSSGLGYYNAAYLFDPQGEIVGKYYKMNPIQFFNDGDPGQEYSVFNTSLGNIGMLICYDMDYSYVARNIVRNGAEMLFIPTYDALRWGESQHRQHSAMTSMRAVENGRFIARTTTSGISQIIDPNGRILEKIGIGESTVKTGYIQPIKKRTFYSDFGYLFPYLCVCFSIIFLIFSFLKRTKKQRIK